MKAFEPLLVHSILANQYPTCICIRKRAPFVAAFAIKMAITVIDNNLTGSHFEGKNGILPGVYLTLHTNTYLNYKIMYYKGWKLFFYTRKCWTDSVINLWFAPSSSTKGPSNRRGEVFGSSSVQLFSRFWIELQFLRTAL